MSFYLIIMKWYLIIQIYQSMIFLCRRYGLLYVSAASHLMISSNLHIVRPFDKIWAVLIISVTSQNIMPKTSAVIIFIIAYKNESTRFLKIGQTIARHLKNIRKISKLDFCDF